MKYRIKKRLSEYDHSIRYIPQYKKFLFWKSFELCSGWCERVFESEDEAIDFIKMAKENLTNSTQNK